MHGFGVRPAAWAATYGRDDVVVEVVAEVEDVVVDAELLGHAPGVVDVADRAAARVALAAPQLHRDPDDVPARRRAGARRRPTSRRRRSWPRGPSVESCGGRPCCSAAAWRRRRGSPRGPGRPRRRSRRTRARAAARRRPPPWARPWPPARATAPSPRSRTTRRPTRTRRPGRAGTAAPRSRRPRCTRAPSRPTLADGRHGLDASQGRRPAARPRAGRAAPRPARPSRRARRRGDAQRLGHGHDAGDVVRAAAAVALLAAAEQQRLERHAVAHDQRADALRAAELVGADATRGAAAAATRGDVEPRPRPARRRCAARRPGARSATISATAAKGWTVPTSLLASITDTTRDLRRRGRSASASRSTRPVPSTPTTRPPRCSTGWSTAWCSTAVHTATPPCRRIVPSTARLSASVPQPVNTTSPGWQPRHGGHHVARLVDGLAGVARRRVAARGVGEALASGTGASPRPPRDASASWPRGRGRRSEQRSRLKATSAEAVLDWRHARLRPGSYGPDELRRRPSPTSTTTGTATCPTSTATVAALRELAGAGPVLELGVGTGRLALPLAAAGVEVHGLDASEAMLARLRAKPGGDAVDAHARRHGDRPARRAVHARAVRLQHVLQPRLRRRPRPRASPPSRRRLRPGGRFVLEAFVPEPRARDPRRAGSSVRGPRPRRSTGSCCPWPATTSPTQDAHGQFVELTEAGGVRLRPGPSTGRRPTQLDAMATAAGFALERRSAGWSGEPFTADK